MSASTIPVPSTIEGYRKLASALLKSSEADRWNISRLLCRIDTYWLLWAGCGRKDVEKPWLLERCKEFDLSPNGHLDLWARDHYKSTIITFGGTIRSILASHGEDPLMEREQCIGIFSHTRPIAKGFLRQIKYEFETNGSLKELFPDILWTKPDKEAPKWSEDDGITVKRKSNPKEATLEAWGLVDGQPTSKHYTGMVFDDVVTRESVTTPEMIEKTTQAVELSFNLGSQGQEWRRMIGTRYHSNDTYRTMIERGVFNPRIYAATADGTVDGEPVFLSRDLIAQKRRDMGPYTFGAQMLQNPVADATQGFKRDWLRHYHKSPDDIAGGLNKYILVDAANDKRKTNDYTAMWVVGLGADGNFYVLDMVRDRLNLTERADKLLSLHRKWKPIEVRYERYGMMADIQHIKYRQEEMNYRFEIVEVAGQTPKNDRIRRLIPLFEQGKVYLPDSMHKTDYEGQVRELVGDFIEQEYASFPVPLHDDMLDALARIAEPDIELIWPQQPEEKADAYSRHKPRRSAWAA
jgi:predicted phage terminase large subunit-like protein